MVDGKVTISECNFVRANPCSTIGMVASHLDAPFSDATCIAHFTLLASFPASCVASEIDFTTVENT